MKWLNAFGIINEIAANKILKKFMKEHFKMKDNIADKCVLRIMDEFEFVKRQNLNAVNKDVKLIYS